MFKSKIFVSVAIFSVLMFLTALIKTETRIIEKNINLYETKVNNLKSSLHEAQLDFFYLTSPNHLSEKILEYSDEEYVNLNLSKIYFGINEFKTNQNKTTKSFFNDKKIQKK